MKQQLCDSYDAFAELMNKKDAVRKKLEGIGKATAATKGEWCHARRRARVSTPCRRPSPAARRRCHVSSDARLCPSRCCLTHTRTP